MTCRILVSRPGIEPMPTMVEAQSTNHQTAKNAPGTHFEVRILRP